MVKFQLLLTQEVLDSAFADDGHFCCSCQPAIPLLHPSMQQVFYSGRNLVEFYCAVVKHFPCQWWVF